MVDSDTQWLLAVQVHVAVQKPRLVKAKSGARIWLPSIASPLSVAAVATLPGYNDAAITHKTMTNRRKHFVTAVNVVTGNWHFPN